MPIVETVRRGTSVIGSTVGTRKDLAEVFELPAGGRTRAVAETRRLDEVNACSEELLEGRVPARLVSAM